MKWFRSYLTGRSQYIRINGCCSSSQHLLQGAPQGSILGPILFLAFINGMLLDIRDSTLDVYADDTTLSKSASWENISHIKPARNQALTKPNTILNVFKYYFKKLFLTCFMKYIKNRAKSVFLTYFSTAFNGV